MVRRGEGGCRRIVGDVGGWPHAVRLSMRHGVSAELDVNPGLELTRMSPEEIQSVTISYD